MATSSVRARLQPFDWVVAALLGVAVLAIAVQQQFSAVVLGGAAAEPPGVAAPPRTALPYVEPYRRPSAAEQALSIAVAGVSPRLDQALRFERLEAAVNTPAPSAAPVVVAAAASPVVVAAAPSPVSVYRPVRWRPAVPPAKAPPAVRALPNDERVVAEPFVPLTPWFVTRRR